MELWRELSAEPPGPEDRLAGAAAVAACALAHGAPLPAETAAEVRPGVPGLLSMGVRMPGAEGGQEVEDEGTATRGEAAPGGRHSRAEGQTPLAAPLQRQEARDGPAAAAAGPQACPSSSCARPACCDGAVAGAARCPCTLRLPLGVPSSRAGGGASCVFTLDHPVSPRERQLLVGFCDQLGTQLERARQHLAKQRLEVRAGRQALTGAATAAGW